MTRETSQPSGKPIGVLVMALGLVAPRFSALAENASSIFATPPASRTFSAIAQSSGSAYEATAGSFREAVGVLGDDGLSFSAEARDPLNSYSAFAQGGYPGEREGEPRAYTALAERSGWRVQLSQRYGAQYAINTGSARANQADLLVQPTVRVETPGGLKFTATARARLDAFDTLEVGREKSSELSRANRPLQIGDRLDLELRELYVDAKIGKADLRLGKQSIKWGNSQGFKILDVVTPVDLREFILADDEDAKIPLVSANLTLPFSETTKLSTVWVVDPSYNNIPAEDTGSTFDLTSVLLMPMVPKNLPFPVIVNDFNRRKRNFKDSQIGFEFSTVQAGAKITLNYLSHFDNVTVGFVTPPSGPGQALVVDREYKRTQLYGGSISRFFGPLQLRAELGFETKHYLSNNDPTDADSVTNFGDFQYVLGADFVGLPDTVLSFQLFQSRITRPDDFLERDREETQLNFFVQRKLSENLSFRSIFLYSTNRADGLIRPRFTYTLSKSMSVYLGADYFYGTINGFFGQFDKQDQVVLGFDLRM